MSIKVLSIKTMSKRILYAALQFLGQKRAAQKCEEWVSNLEQPKRSFDVSLCNPKKFQAQSFVGHGDMDCTSFIKT